MGRTAAYTAGGNSRTRQMNPTVNLSFRYLEADYVLALRAHYVTHLRLPLDIVVVIILISNCWLSTFHRLTD